MVCPALISNGHFEPGIRGENDVRLVFAAKKHVRLGVIVSEIAGFAGIR